VGARHGVPLVITGAAGGKRRPQAVEVDDLAAVTHDPLLAALRQRLRKHHGAPRIGPLGLPCVSSREPVMRPPAACAPSAPDGRDGPDEPDLGRAGSPLACAGYGSSVTVTATFGMVAAGQAIEQALRGSRYNGGLCLQGC
jgi:tRNA A37 threonylcarbamoyladenosine dehydratase